MTESVLERLIKFKPLEGVDQDQEEVTDYGLVGWHRGVRDRALFIDFWRRTGECISLPYALLEKVIYNPSESITLIYMGAKVTIKGSRLDQPLHGTATLRDGIVRHRVMWVREADRDLATFGDNKLLRIESISL